MNRRSLIARLAVVPLIVAAAFSRDAGAASKSEWQERIYRRLVACAYGGDGRYNKHPLAFAVSMQLASMREHFDKRIDALEERAGIK